MKQKFLDRQYKEEVPDEKIMKVDRIQRKELFTCKQKKPQQKQNSTINNILTAEHSQTYLKL